MPDELPAVTVPLCLRNAGRQRRQLGGGRLGPRVLVDLEHPRRPFLLRHRHRARARRRSARRRARPPSAAGWSSAKASCASRVTPYFSATSSAVSPSACVPCSASMRGLTNRQPSVLSWTVTSPRGNASRALGITSGARDIDSTPPAMTRSASPAAIARAPSIDRLQPRAAQAVDRRARHGDGQPGEQQAHARDVAVVLARLVRAAEVARRRCRRDRRPRAARAPRSRPRPGRPGAPRPARRGTARSASEPRRRPARHATMPAMPEL